MLVCLADLTFDLGQSGQSFFEIYLTLACVLKPFCSSKALLFFLKLKNTCLQNTLLFSKAYQLVFQLPYPGHDEIFGLVDVLNLVV